MFRTLLAAGTVLALSMAPSACATSQQSATDASEEMPTRIVVENYNPLTVTVDAVSSGEDYRLGTVETTDTETFTLPATVSDYDLRILVDPIGTPDTWLSEDVLYSPGDVIDVRIEATLDLSTVTPR